MTPPMTVTVYDTRRYDRDSLTRAAEGQPIAWRFLEARLTVDTAPLARGAQAVVAFVNDHLDRACLQSLAAEGVRLVAMRSTGFNNVDLNAARELGVAVTRVPVYSPYAVAEHAVALLLALNRRIHRAHSRVREQNFSLEGLVGFDLHGKTAGIVGTGKIGRVIAGILAGFGMRLLAYDPFPAEDWARSADVTYVPWTRLVAESDVVTLHLPLTMETTHLVRRASLAAMKPGAILINVSRGGLIDTGDLIEALKSGHLGGVGLDVYEEEEGLFHEDLSGEVLQDDVFARLLTFPNVLITAHQAFLTREALGDIGRTTVANLAALAEGKPYVEGSLLT